MRAAKLERDHPVHDYLLPNGLVQIWLTADSTIGDDVNVTIAYSLGRPPACIVACGPRKLSGEDGTELESLVTRIIDKAHKLLRTAPADTHVDAFRDAIVDWVLTHRYARRWMLSAA